MMRVRPFFRVLAAIAVAAGARFAAADDTAELLKAPLVKRSIYVQPANAAGTSLVFSIDKQDAGADFPANPVFAISNHVAFIFAEYNPLKYRIRVDTKDEADPNFEQLRQFIQKLNEFETALTQA